MKKATQMVNEHKFIVIKAVNNKIVDAFNIAEKVCATVKNL